MKGRDLNVTSTPNRQDSKDPNISGILPLALPGDEGGPSGLQSTQQPSSDPPGVEVEDAQEKVPDPEANTTMADLLTPIVSQQQEAVASTSAVRPSIGSTDSTFPGFSPNSQAIGEPEASGSSLGQHPLGAYPKVPSARPIPTPAKRPLSDREIPLLSREVLDAILRQALAANPDYLNQFMAGMAVSNANQPALAPGPSSSASSSSAPAQQSVPDPRIPPPAPQVQVTVQANQNDVVDPRVGRAPAAEEEAAGGEEAVAEAEEPPAPQPPPAAAQPPAAARLRSGGSSMAIAARGPNRVPPAPNNEATMMHVYHKNKHNKFFFPVDDPGKLGRHSVHPTHTVAFPLGSNSDKGQLFLTGIWRVLRSQPERVRVLADSVQIRGNVQMPMYQGVAPNADVVSIFDKTVPANSVLRETRISWGKTVEVGKVDKGALETFMPNKLPELRQVISTMRGSTFMSNNLATALCPLIQQGHTQFDLVGMFTCLFILLDFLQTCDNNRLNRNVNPLAADPVTYANVATEEAQFNVPYQPLRAAIYGQYIVVAQRDISEREINVMRALSLGPQMWNLAANAVRPIHYWFRWDMYQWLVWNSGPVYNVGIDDVLPADLLTFAFKIASIYKCNDALVRGFIRASTLINGVRNVATGSREQFFICASIEAEQICLPKPVGRNVIWTMICTVWESYVDQGDFAMDLNTLQNLNNNDWMQMSAASGAVISVGVSTAFNHFNIDGRCLNDWANHAQVPSTPFLRNWFEPIPGTCVLPVFNSACLVISTFTGWSLSNLCLTTFNWCNNFNNRNNVPDDDLWRRVWGRWVPYPVQPLSLQWCLIAYPCEWGYSGPNPEFSMHQEMIILGPEAARGIYTYLGDLTYFDAAQSNEPFRFVPYAAHFLNALKGHFRDDANTPFSYRGFTNAGGDGVYQSAEYWEDQEYQPDYVDGLFCLKAGTVKSFNWPDYRVFGVVIRAGNIGVADWRTWRQMYGMKIQSYAGYTLRFAPEISELTIGNYDIMRMLGIEAGDKLAPAKPAPEEKDKEEN